jgi:REP element-mobilizing transposase RayT
MNSGEDRNSDAGAGRAVLSRSGERRAATSATRRSCPPYNPGLHKLVSGKQAWAEPLDEESKARGFLGWHQRGYLPHDDVPGVTQLVTFRLQDALPASRRGEWEALLRIEDDRRRRTRLEAYLDRGVGECWLREPSIAKIVEGAVRYVDGRDYQLRAWVVMPNHVHALVEVWQRPLARVVCSWKGFTARKANGLLGRSGKFWEREYWDARIGGAEHLRQAVRYIEGNPVKAGLVAVAGQWPWSSARFRDQYGVLRAPRTENLGAPAPQCGTGLHQSRG